MNHDDRIRLTFMTLYGATTYVDATGKDHSDLDGYSANDIDLIKRSANDYSYTKEAYKILIDVCDYFEATPREDLDIQYLHSAPLRSHDIEESAKRQFLHDLYAQLSTRARAFFDEKMAGIHETASGGSGTSIREDVDCNDPYMRDAIIANTERACPIIRAGYERMVNDNWIQEPSSMAMEVGPYGSGK